MSTNLSLQNKSIADIDNLEYLNRAWKRLPWGKFISINSVFVDITGNLKTAQELLKASGQTIKGAKKTASLLIFQAA